MLFHVGTEGGSSPRRPLNPLFNMEMDVRFSGADGASSYKQTAPRSPHRLRFPLRETVPSPSHLTYAAIKR